VQGHAKPSAGFGKPLGGTLVELGQKLAVQGHNLMPGVAQAQQRGQTVAAAAHGHRDGAGPGHDFGPQSPVSAARTYLRKA